MKESYENEKLIGSFIELCKIEKLYNGAHKDHKGKTALEIANYLFAGLAFPFIVNFNKGNLIFTNKLGENVEINEADDFFVLRKVFERVLGIFSN